MLKKIFSERGRMQSKIHKCGEKLVIDLPADVSAKLDWSVGDVVNLELVDAGLKVTLAMSAHDHAMKIARDGMDKYRETLEALAKS